MTNSRTDNQSEAIDEEETASQDIPNPMAVSEEDLRLRA